MSPASYLTAPPRVAASIVAPGGRKGPLTTTIGAMIWGALAFCVLAVLGSLTYVALSGLRLWRTFRATARRATAGLERVTASAAAAEEHALGLTAGTERLATATSRLQEALAELAVIRTAAAEPRALLKSVRGIVPGK
jgi:hypothetical protein